MRRGIFLFLLTSFSTCLIAQSKVQFKANTDAERLLSNQSFQIHYTLENADGSNFQAPNFAPFTVLRGPSVSNSLQIINGKRSSSRSYSFTLAAPKPGKYTIPAAKIVVQGNTLSSNSLTVEVVSGGMNPKSTKGKKIFGRYEINTDSPYVGEPLVLDLVIYSQKRIHNVYKQSDPDRSDWYSVNLPTRPAKRKTVVNGMSYQRQVLKRELLFGQKSGFVKIDPLYLQVEIEDENKGRSSPFSFFRSHERKDIIIPDTTVYVRGHPKPLPEDFSGLVGEVNIEGKLESGQVSLGEAAEYSLRLETYSDPNVIKPPKLIAKNAEVLSPKLRYEGKEDSQRGRTYIYIYDYLIIPESPGVQSFYPEIITLNNKTGKYDTIRANAREIWVSQPKAVDQKKAPDALEETKAAENAPPESTTYRPWLLAGIPVLLILLWAAFRFRKKQKQHFSEDVTLEENLRELLKDKRPRPQDLRKCLEKLKARDKEDPKSADQWQQFLRDLDFLEFSPAASEKDWDRILDKWRGQISA
jgi:hypothetical protein